MLAWLAQSGPAKLIALAYELATDQTTVWARLGELRRAGLVHRDGRPHAHLYRAAFASPLR